MSGGGEESAERGWDFEFVDYEPGPDSGVVVIQSAPKLDGIKRATRDAMTGWTKHRVTVTGGDAAAVAFDPELRDELIERALLFVEYFPHEELTRLRKRLVVDAGVMVRRELDQEPLRMHTAVQITANGFGDHHGIVTGLPRTDGRGRNIYEVTYWYGQSGDGARQPFHRRDLAALVRPREQPSMSIR